MRAMLLQEERNDPSFSSIKEEKDVPPQTRKRVLTGNGID